MTRGTGPYTRRRRWILRSSSSNSGSESIIPLDVPSDKEETLVYSECWT